MRTKVNITALLIVLTIPAFPQPAPTANEIVNRVNARHEGEYVTQKFNLELIDKNGKKQTRETIIYRMDFRAMRRTMLFFLAPSNVRGTGFLTFDYFETGKEDDQWLYLPALRKTRRISSANRGDYFLGTDLTYEDIKLGTKLSIKDYSFILQGEEIVQDKKYYVLEATPLSAKVRDDLGYSKVHYYIDPVTWISMKSAYWDVAGNPLKTIEIKEIKLVDGIWTIQHLTAVNHKNGHQSLLHFMGADYKTKLNEDFFTEQTLVRGL